jgi:hypothetical protein
VDQRRFELSAGVPQEYKAIHLHAGQSQGAELVDAWLRRHRVREIGLKDPYEACVYLIRHAEQVPDLAFVDADSLTREELTIVQYLRETWPAIGIIIYSNRDQAELPDSGPLQRACHGAASLRQLLESPPERLLRRLRIFPDQEPNGGTRRGNSRPAVARADTTPPQPPAGLPAQPAPPRKQTDNLPRGILSPEELSALLEEKEPQE